MVTESTALAQRFASSLDHEDYPTAAACLAPACRYETGAQIHLGPEAIIGSYREHGDWAASTLDSVRYESVVRTGEPGELIVEFIDHIEHARVAQCPSYSFGKMNDAL